MSDTEEQKTELTTTDPTTRLSIFDSSIFKERKEALNNFFRGRTPQNEIRKRDGRGGGKVNYVNGYWMFHQATLITGSRWDHKKTGVKYRPNEENPIEVTTYVEVTFWDENGNQYTHPGTGTKDVARYKKDTYKKEWNGKESVFIDLGIDSSDITWQQEKRKQRHIFEVEHHKGEIISLGDDEKASETDAVKKALSYFGIANDVYGHREKKFKDVTAEEEDEENDDAILEVNQEYQEFCKWIKRNHIMWSEVYEILNTKEVKDYKIAKDKIKEVKGIKE